MEFNAGKNLCLANCYAGRFHLCSARMSLHHSGTVAIVAIISTSNQLSTHRVHPVNANA
jgi:hypothetical protein